MTGVDVEHPLRIAALDASIGREAGLQGWPREGPESAPKPSVHCEREVGFTALSGSSFERHGPSRTAELGIHRMGSDLLESCCRRLYQLALRERSLGRTRLPCSSTVITNVVDEPC